MTSLAQIAYRQHRQGCDGLSTLDENAGDQ